LITTLSWFHTGLIKSCDAIGRIIFAGVSDCINGIGDNRQVRKVIAIIYIAFGTSDPQS